MIKSCFEVCNLNSWEDYLGIFALSVAGRLLEYLVKRELSGEPSNPLGQPNQKCLGGENNQITNLSN